ncbi:MAG: CDP-alcohol phosphatidyltransferase family protein [Chthoniobacterales bacterium]
MKVVILADAPYALQELCGISLLERLLRTLQRAGVRAAVVLSRTLEPIDVELRKKSSPRSELEVTLKPASEPISGDELRLTLPADVVWDSRLLSLLLAQEKPCVLLDSGQPTGAMISRGPAATTETRILEVAEQPTYSREMRRDLPLLRIPAPGDDDERKAAERRILAAAQKGALDLPALVHGPVETFFVARLCKTSITPNQLTALCNVVAWATAVFFATGYLVTGTCCALAVGVLDGLDGKQARVKVETSAAGKLEHWLDAFYELAWALALAFYLHASGALPSAWWYLLLLLVAEGVGGLAKLSVIRHYGCLIDELTPLDRKIRLFSGRRNIYIWILAFGLLLGAPASAFVLIAAWQAVSAFVHVLRAAWVTKIRPLDLTAGR